MVSVSPQQHSTLGSVEAMAVETLLLEAYPARHAMWAMGDENSATKQTIERHYPLSNQERAICQAMSTSKGWNDSPVHALMRSVHSKFIFPIISCLLFKFWCYDEQFGIRPQEVCWRDTIFILMMLFTMSDKSVIYFLKENHGTSYKLWRSSLGRYSSIWRLTDGVFGYSPSAINVVTAISMSGRTFTLKFQVKSYENLLSKTFSEAAILFTLIRFKSCKFRITMGGKSNSRSRKHSCMRVNFGMSDKRRFLRQRGGERCRHFSELYSPGITNKWKTTRTIVSGSSPLSLHWRSKRVRYDVALPALSVYLEPLWCFAISDTTSATFMHTRWPQVAALTATSVPILILKSAGSLMC